MPYSVEARLFCNIVRSDLKNSEFQAPFPLMDLSSMLYSKGYVPLTERTEPVDCSGMRRHNVMDDVRKSIKIWKKMIVDLMTRFQRFVSEYDSDRSRMVSH